MSGQIVHGRTLDKGFDRTFDAVVIGSGAGGAVAATHLAEAGWEVLVLEEGPYYRPEEYAQFRPSESMRRMWREAGLLAAFGVGQTPIISIAVGRNIGGSSVHTGGVCFRVPSSVHHEWEHDQGLSFLSERRMEDAYIEVERRAHIREIPPDERSRSTDRFVQGANRLGIPMQPIRRNTVGCEGLARCNFGCPAKAKMSVDQSFLPSALEHGTEVISDALVDRVLMDGTRAIGVEGSLLGGRYGARSHRFVARARRAVIVACGTLHTPLLLMNTGIKNVHVGRHVTLHPAARVTAFFKDRLEPWNGALQSVYSDHFADEGITLVGVSSPPSVLVAGMPGWGPEHRALARRLPHVAAFGAMIHDDGGGTIRAAPSGREGIVSYEMAARDLKRLRKSMRILGEMAFAAGAQEVVVPVFGVGAIRDLATLKRLETEPLDAHRIECLAFHPLGSARIANDPKRGVVDESGLVYGTRGLYVMDGSILPTSIGVNSQVAIMTMATHLSWRLRNTRH